MTKDTEMQAKESASKSVSPPGKQNRREKEALFYIHELREHSRELFGVRPEVVDGALFGVKGIRITKSEARKRIEMFLSKGVKSK